MGEVALLRAVGAVRFRLDRHCQDRDAPLRCEVGRVVKALGGWPTFNVLLGN